MSSPLNGRNCHALGLRLLYQGCLLCGWESVPGGKQKHVTRLRVSVQEKIEAHLNMRVKPLRFALTGFLVLLNITIRRYFEIYASLQGFFCAVIGASWSNFGGISNTHNRTKPLKLLAYGCFLVDPVATIGFIRVIG